MKDQTPPISPNWTLFKSAWRRRCRRRGVFSSLTMCGMGIARNGSLFAPLRGSMIMVTTRSETVVRAMAGTLDPIFLKGLPEDDYMEFFKTCAFGSKNPKDHPVMEKIAERIAAKLKGSPLAAKTLGGSLNSNMDVKQWRNIMNSEIWQLQQDENDIIPVLRFSYQHLPLHLKPCFSICSIYPQDYCFKATELVYLWMAQGFLVAPRPNMLLEDVGKEYLHDLTSRSFFQKCPWEDDAFQIHDLMHDMAKYVSKDDCFSIPNDGPKIPSSIRHLSIKCTENHELLDEEHGHGIDELKNLKQLHGSLRIGNLENVESREDACQANLDNKEYIDELTLEWDGDRDTSIAGSIDFSGDTEVLEGLKPHRDLKKLGIEYYRGDKLPSWLQTQTLPFLYSLGFECCPNITDLGLNSLPLLGGEGSVDQGIYARGSNSMRSSALSELYLIRCQNLTSLEECLLPERLPSIKIIHIEDCEELVSLPVERFKNFIPLEELSIEYCPRLTSSKKLELNPSIKVLKLCLCGELELSTPSSPQNLTSLIKLEISHSLHLKRLPGQLLHHMPTLKNLTITYCPELRSIGGLDALTSLEYLTILECPKLTDLESLRSEHEVQRKDQFISNWTIDKTVLLKQSFAHILPSFHLNLSIHCSKESVWFDEGDDQEWLQILTSLRNLEFLSCQNLQSLPTWLHRLTSLQALRIRDCPAIESLPENGLPTSLTKIQFHKIHPMLRKQLEEKHRALLDPASLR